MSPCSSSSSGGGGSWSSQLHYAMINPEKKKYEKDSVQRGIFSYRLSKLGD
jgi:hypothetical protein